MGDVTGKHPTPNSHMDGVNGAKTMVYNTKRKPKEKKKRRKRKEKKERGRSKKYNSKKKEL